MGGGRSGAAVKDRFVTLLGALAALAVVYALFLKRPGEPPVTRPVSMEPGANGYRAVRTWLEREGVAVVSLQERYSRLNAEHFPFAASGNVLITTMPHVTPVRSTELEPLSAWLAAGNTLLVLAALDDTPDWASGDLLRDLLWTTGLSFRPYGFDENGEPLEDARVRPASRALTDSASVIELEPVGAHPLMEGVSRLLGFSDQVSGLWTLAERPSEAVLRLATETHYGLDAIWQTPRGQGQIIVVASGSLLANRNIGHGDARVFLANLVAHHVARDGAVIFDDMHQGVSTLYDPAAFFRDARLTYTLLFVVALWLVYIVGSSNRLAPPVAARTAPRQSDFLAAAGGFMARRLDRVEAGLLLFSEWFDEVRRSRGLQPASEPPWAEIEATPALARALCRELRASHDRLRRGTPVDLLRLHNLLRRARDAIG